jgi:hypothetical protein
MTPDERDQAIKARDAALRAVMLADPMCDADSIANALAPLLVALLAERDALQAKIDAALDMADKWERAARDIAPDPSWSAWETRRQDVAAYSHHVRAALTDPT